jgi:O-antigen/teichoic acid export membrane protein
MPRVLTAGRQFVRGLSTDAKDGLSALGWSYLTVVVQGCFRLISVLFLTRLLLPEVYGVVGPAMAAMFFLELLTDIGLRPAVVRSPNGETEGFLGTAWSLVLIRAWGLSVAMFGLAFVLPGWYGMPQLFGVLLALSGRPLILAVQNPTLYVLYRRLNYKTPFFLDTLQTLVSVPNTIIMAWALGNEWALVIGLLSGDVIRLFLSHVLCPRAPRLHWDRAALRELSTFGFSIFLNTLVFGAWLYFDRLVGPKLLTATEIGLYVMAWSLAENLDVFIQRGSEVFCAMLSRKVDGPDRVEFFRRNSRRMALFLMPGFVLASLAAPLAVKVLLSVPYHGSAVLFALLVARLIMRATSQVQFMYLIIRGQVILATRAYVVSLVILAATFVLWVQTLGLHELGLAVSSVLAMTTFTLAQTVQMVRRREASPWPAIIALGWTSIAVAGVLLIYSR